MKTLLGLLKPYRKKLILVAIIDAFGIITSLLMPYVMSEIVEMGIAKGNIPLIWKYAFIMTTLALVSVVGTVISAKLNTKISTQYTTDVSRSIFKKINSLSYTDYSKIGPSGLLARATDDIFNIEGAVTGLTYTLVSVPIMFIGSAVLAFMADAVLSLVFLLAIPPVLLVVLIIMRPLYEMWDKSDKYIDIQNKIVRERLSGLRVVRAFNNERREHSRASVATEEMSKYIIKANTRGGSVESIAMLLLNLATVAVLYFGTVRAESNEMLGAGDVIAVLQYIALIANALISVSWTLSWLPRLKVSVKRIGEVYALSDEEGSDSDKKAHTSGFDIEIRGLSFKYPGAAKNTLFDLSLSIKEGERVAIIGGTGSGKTTLIRLLTGLFDTNEGEIKLGGVPYSELSKKALRERFSVALQRAMIFEGTIRENIKMGNPDATDGEILDALRLSKMEDFVNSHKEGLDYLLVGMGQNVSGGQKQRLNMARTVIKNADIYVFDDSFCALDYLTESEIRESYRALLSGKTQIVVTQRVSTAMSADRIYVMSDGKIVDLGTHDSLILSSDIYREIALSQLGAAAVGGEAI